MISCRSCAALPCCADGNAISGDREAEPSESRGTEQPAGARLPAKYYQAGRPLAGLIAAIAELSSTGGKQLLIIPGDDRRETAATGNNYDRREPS